MKAIRVNEFGAPEVMKIEEVPDPKAGVGQVVVRLYAAGVNPVDTYIRLGMYAAGPGLPYTPGMDGAGVIEEVGEGVKNFHLGDRVYTARSLSGTYAEKVLCMEEQVHPLPGNITFEEGAGIYVPYGAAYLGLFLKARALPGDIVLVHGASGGVGIAALQLARAAGMQVIGTYGTEKGRGLTLEQGAHQVVNHHSPDHFEQVLALTKGRGVDVILEMLANVNLGKDLEILAPNGRVVVIGSRGRVEIDPRDAMARNASIIGMMLLNVTEQENKIIHSALAASLENGIVKPVIGMVLPLSEAPQAHHLIMESNANGKIVLIP
jgi:NADPH2:quinone reductase